MNIHRRLINYSDACTLTHVVFFQMNELDPEGIPLVWKVIHHCGYMNYHPFTYSTDLEISAGDSYGNYTAHMPAQPGTLYQAIRVPSGNQLAIKGKATNARQIQMVNDLPKGAVSANIFRSNRLLARQSPIAPRQRASFAFKPSIYVGTYSEIEAGEGLVAGVVPGRMIELSLLGLASADIIMTGGGTDEHAEPYQFHLDNIRRA